GIERLPAGKIGRFHLRGEFAAEPVEVIHPRIKDQFRYRFTAGTAERRALAIDFQPAMLAFRYRFAAVETVVHFALPSSMRRSVAFSLPVTRQPLFSSVMRTYQRPGSAPPIVPR